MLSFGKELSSEDYKVAETKINELKKDLGSIDAVAALLSLEEILGNDYLIFEQIVTNAASGVNFNNIYCQVIEDVNNGKIKKEEAILVLLMKITDEIRKDIINNSWFKSQYFDNPDRMILAMDCWCQLDIMVSLYQIKQQIGNNGELSFLSDEVINSARSNVKPTIFLFKPQQQKQLSVNSGSETPPPSPPPSKGTYEEVEPENLIDVHWGNGDSIRFIYAKTLKDDKGRERNFYQAVYEYTPKGSPKKVSINLSEYIKGANILFEGTKGALTGATFDPDKKRRLLGWASDRSSDNEEKSYLVALNLKYLQNSPESIRVIFHELGHVYLYQGDQTKIFKKNIRLFSLLKQVFNQKEVEIAGLNNYRKAVQKVVQKILIELRTNIKEQSSLNISINYDLTSTTHRTIKDQRMEDINKKIDSLSAVYLIRSFWLSNENYHYICRNLPDLNILASIFHERMAGAYSLKQLRKLNPNIDISLALKGEKDNLNSCARQHSDERFIKGI